MGRALKFTLNGAFKEHLSGAFPKRSSTQDVALAVVAGGTAGASETLLHTPFEVVKVRMQSGRIAESSCGPVGVAMGIIRQDGIRGLYTGLEAYALRQVVWNGGFFGLIGLGRILPIDGLGYSKVVTNFFLGLIAG